MLIQSLLHHYITSWSSHVRLYSNLTIIVSCSGGELVMCTHATSRKILTSSPAWLWVRTALCSGVRPSLFLKSRWAPPWTSTLMPSTGRPDCTATHSGVSKPQEANIQPSGVCYDSGALQGMKVLFSQVFFHPTSTIRVMEIWIKTFVKDFCQFLYHSGLNVIQELLQAGLKDVGEELGC